MFGTLASTAFLVAASARAQDKTIDRCIAANDRGLDLKKRGQLLEARKAFAQCAAPACGAELDEACQKGIAEVGALLPSIVFAPKNAAGDDVAGVKLYIDGAAYTERLDGSAVVIDPGEHEFRFEVSGQAPVTKHFVLREREQNRREEVLIGPPAPHSQDSRVNGGSTAPVIIVNQGQKQQYDSTGGFQRTSGTLLLAAVMPAAIVVGLGYGAVAWSKWSSAQSDCKNACASGSSAQNELHAARNAAKGSDIAFAVAGVALVGGIVLRVTAPARKPIDTPATNIQLQAAIGDHAAALIAGGSFQ